MSWRAVGHHYGESTVPYYALKHAFDAHLSVQVLSERMPRYYSREDSEEKGYSQ